MTDVLTRYETYRHHWQANVVLIFGEISDLVSSWEGYREYEQLLLPGG